MLKKKKSPPSSAFVGQTQHKYIYEVAQESLNCLALCSFIKPGEYTTVEIAGCP